MSPLRTSAVVSGLCWVVLAPAGCSGGPDPPAQIKGMTPADYREKQEQALGSPPPDSPAATARTPKALRKR